MKAKRLISLFLCMLMLIGSVQTTVFAAGTEATETTVTGSAVTAVSENNAVSAGDAGFTVTQTTVDSASADPTSAETGAAVAAEVSGNSSEADNAVVSAATTELTVTKVWNDKDLLTMEGYKRPEKVVFQITGTADDGTPAESTTITVTAEDNWTRTIEMPARDRRGIPVTYTVTEQPNEGYDTTEVQIRETVENTADCDPCYVTVRKADAVDTEKVLQGAVITLTNEKNETAGTKTTGKDGLVTFKLTEAGTYYVQETAAPDGYTLNTGKIPLSVVLSADGKKLELSCDEAVEGVITITDVKQGLVPETGDGTITVNKVWDDAKIRETVYNYEQFYSRPEEITFTLTGTLNGKTVITRTAALTPMGIDDGYNESPVTFENLPLTASDGTAIEYTVTEEPVTVTMDVLDEIYSYTYQPAYTWNTDHTVCTCTNTVGAAVYERILDERIDKTDTVTYTVEKVWQNVDPDTIPDSVTIHLEGVNDSCDVTLYKDEGWTGTVVNFYFGEYRKVTYILEGWEVGGQYYSTTESTETVTNGDRNITVTESGSPDGLEMSSIVNTPYFNAYGNRGSTGYITVTNRDTSRSSGVIIKKVWEDCDNADGIRPDSVTVQFTANAIRPDDYWQLPQRLREKWDYDHPSVDQTITLSAANNWQYRIPRVLKAEAYNITIEEETVKGYTAVCSDPVVTTPSSGITQITYTLTNTHTPAAITEPAELTVLKTSADTGEVLEGAVFTAVNKADSSISYTATTGKDGVAVLSFSEAGTYTISETTAPDGYEKASAEWTVTVSKTEGKNAKGVTVYTCSVSGDALKDGTLSVSDAKLPSTADLVVTKVWDDGNDAKGIRPDSVTVTAVSSDGQSFTETLTADNGWMATRKVNTQDENFNPVTWTVTEEDVPTGYTAEITGKDTVWTVTNACDYPTKSITITKTWDDSYRSDDPEYTRPSSVSYTVEGYVDGVKVSTETVTATENKEWTVTLPGLPTTHQGKTVNYVVKEVATPDYTPTTVSVTTIVTNTPRTDERYQNGTLTISKVDANTGAGLSGAVFEISFAGSDTAPAKTERVTTADGVATYLISEPGTYTVKEVTAPSGYSINTETFTVTAAYGTPTVTNEDGVYIKNYPLVLDGTANGVLTVNDSRVTGNTTTPSTGDATNITLWIALMMVSGLGLIALTAWQFVYRRRHAHK